MFERVRLRNESGKCLYCCVLFVLSENTDGCLAVRRVGRGHMTLIALCVLVTGMTDSLGTHVASYVLRSSFQTLVCVCRDWVRIIMELTADTHR